MDPLHTHSCYVQLQDEDEVSTGCNETVTHTFYSSLVTLDTQGVQDLANLHDVRLCDQLRCVFNALSSQTFQCQEGCQEYFLVSLAWPPSCHTAGVQEASYLWTRRYSDFSKEASSGGSKWLEQKCPLSLHPSACKVPPEQRITAALQIC